MDHAPQGKLLLFCVLALIAAARAISDEVAHRQGASSSALASSRALLQNEYEYEYEYYDADTGEVMDGDPGDWDTEIAQNKDVAVTPKPKQDAPSSDKKEDAPAPTASEDKKEDKKEEQPARNIKKRRVKKKPILNKMVSFAPEANITGGDDIEDDGEGGCMGHAAMLRERMAGRASIVLVLLFQASARTRLRSCARTSRRARASWPSA